MPGPRGRAVRAPNARDAARRAGLHDGGLDALHQEGLNCGEGVEARGSGAGGVRGETDVPHGAEHSGRPARSGGNKPRPVALRAPAGPDGTGHPRCRRRRCGVPAAASPAGITPAPAMGGPYRGGHRGEGGAVKAGVLIRRSSTASEAPDGGGEAICPAKSARRGGMRPGPSGGVLRPPDAPGARRRPSVPGPGPVGHGCAENGGTAGARLDGAAGRTALRAAVPAGLPWMGLPGGGGPRPPSSPVARSSARRAPAALASEREATTARPTRHRSPS